MVYVFIDIQKHFHVQFLGDLIKSEFSSAK